MADAEIVSLRAKLASRPRSDDYRQRRRDFDARSLEYGVASDVTVEPVTANGVRAEWTSTPQDGSDAALPDAGRWRSITGWRPSTRFRLRSKTRLPGIVIC